MTFCDEGRLHRPNSSQCPADGGVQLIEPPLTLAVRSTSDDGSSTGGCAGAVGDAPALGAPGSIGIAGSPSSSTFAAVTATSFAPLELVGSSKGGGTGPA